MNINRLFRIASNVALKKSLTFKNINQELSKAHNVDHVRSLLGQYHVKLFKEPPYPNDIPRTENDLEVGIESVKDEPLGSLHFLHKTKNGWEIRGVGV